MPDRLEQRLAALAAEIEFPPTPDLAPAVAARLGEPAPRRRRMRPARRSLALALARARAARGRAGAVPAVRDAVGDLLGLDGATVERVPRLPASPGEIDLGRPVTAGEAARELGAPPAHAARCPARRAPRRLPARPRTGRRRPRSSIGGLLLTQFRGDLNPDLVAKFIGPDTGTRRVRVRGAPGFWIEGPHSFGYRDADGLIRIEELRMSERALLWTQGPMLLRLEASLPLRRALEIAREVR